MLPFIINIICAVIVILCLALCLLAHYELIHGIWFMVGLIVGCTVFFGTISANIYVNELNRKYTTLFDWWNNTLDGSIRWKKGDTETNLDFNNGGISMRESNSLTNAYKQTSLNSGAINMSSSKGSNKSSSSTTVNFSGISQLVNLL